MKLLSPRQLFEIFASWVSFNGAHPATFACLFSALLRPPWPSHSFQPCRLQRVWVSIFIPYKSNISDSIKTVNFPWKWPPASDCRPIWVTFSNSFEKFGLLLYSCNSCSSCRFSSSEIPSFLRRCRNQFNFRWALYTAWTKYWSADLLLSVQKLSIYFVWIFPPSFHFTVKIRSFAFFPPSMYCPMKSSITRIQNSSSVLSGRLFRNSWPNALWVFCCSAWFSSFSLRCRNESHSICKVGLFMTVVTSCFRKNSWISSFNPGLLSQISHLCGHVTKLRFSPRRLMILFQDP